MPTLKRFLAALLLGCAALAAQPSCSINPDTQARLDALDKGRESIPSYEYAAWARPQLEKWLTAAPGDIDLHRRYIELFTQDVRLYREFPALRERYRQRAETRKDAASVYLYGFLLQRFNTAESVRQLERAKELDPKLYYPYVSLSSILSRSAKFKNEAKAAENMAKYFELCPTGFEVNPLYILLRAGTPELQAQVAHNLRQALEAETAPRKLLFYERLWRLEFRVRPMSEHAELRKQIAVDLQRLEKLTPKPASPEWYEMLISGHKQAGSSRKIVTALEDRLIREQPASQQAFSLVSRRTYQEKKPPAPAATAAEWDVWLEQNFARQEEMLRQYPGIPYLKDSLLQYLRYLPKLPDARVLEIVNEWDKRNAGNPDVSSSMAVTAADVLMQRGLALDRVPALLDTAAKSLDVPNIMLDWDETSDQARKIMMDYKLRQRQLVAEATLRAARLLKRPELAARVKAQIEPPAPEPLKTERLANLARLAEVEGRTADALAYYQAALHSRKKDPDPVYGRVVDPLTEDARRFWKSTGGTDVAWEMWRKPAVNIQISEKGTWERPTQRIEDFDLPDLTGKRWRLKSLEGKAVLINVWATWCGPCQTELPHLQKLYEQVKDRSDIAILSLNIDSEIGLVEPFVKEKKYTFPVLPAERYVTTLLESVGVPQNWIIDAQGKWQWVQMGFNPAETDWERTVLTKLMENRNLNAAP